MGYALGVLTAQQLLAALCGAGRALSPGSGAAQGLVWVVFSVQLGVALWITCLRPSNDRIDNLTQQLGWGKESGATGLLLLAALAPDAHSHGAVMMAALALALLGCALPIVQMTYDSLLAPLVRRLLGCADARGAGGEGGGGDKGGATAMASPRQTVVRV